MNPASPSPIPLRDLRPALFAAALAMLMIYLVQFDQGALSQTGMFLHELAHDGRHLLGVPCH
jgi:cobalt transporter subunit CbtB